MRMPTLPAVASGEGMASERYSFKSDLSKFLIDVFIAKGN